MEKIVVKQLRKNLNLTLKEMATRLGVNKSTVWRWEKYGVPSKGAVAYLLETLWDEQFSPPTFCDDVSGCRDKCEHQQHPSHS
ncbi:MAG: helix-turn-helix transcriptional regulator [Bartonella sp.]|nr:helix-turn-helix transcriptional regulator [Bartonella sp.]MDD9332746.1 helix-turn-helix transcriptional regulator [Bartonella sp.]